MINGHGTPKTWQEVVGMGITLVYRLVALYLLRDLLDGQRNIADIVLKAHGMS